jgi:hypothetical protein
MLASQTKWESLRGLLLSPGINLSTMVKLDKKKVVLYGAGQLGVEVAHRLKKVDVSIALWVDQGSNNTSMSEFDTCICLPRDIPSVEFDFIILCSDIYREEMLDNCISVGIPINKIIHI